MNYEQQAELKALEEAKEVLAHAGIGNDEADDKKIEIAVLLMLATRLHRLNCQLDDLIAATRQQ